MLKKKRTKMTQVYRKHENTDRILIEVALDRYEDIFNEWDPAPFKRRDIDPDLRSFFEECSREISLRHPLAIAFFLPKAELDYEKQEKCVEGLRNFFIFNRHLAEKRIRLSLKSALRYFLIGIIFLVIATVFENFFEKSVLSGVLGQGLFIGGWVFIWEAFSIAIFKNKTAQYRIKEWDRFLDAPVIFKKERKPDQTLE